MTTTSQFQKKPDYYSTVDECRKASKSKIVTNPRYSEFLQTHFTAGDEDQFQEYRDLSNGDVCIPRISLDDNKFKDIDLSNDVLWVKYENLNAMCVNNTFQYMFQKLKKGIFVKIQDNKVKVFLPFSKKGFVNEWGDKIKIDPKFGNMHSFITHINRMMGKKYKVSVNRFPDNWYANNCLVRSEFPINEGDTNNSEMSDMLNVLCANRKIPDMEFFVNRRDFPVIKKNGTEPYDHIFGDNHPLLSHDYGKYSPILSMVTTDEYADVPIPTGDDWSRIGSYEGKFFGDDCKLFPTIDLFNIEWKNKKPTAVFRGASTGCGVNIDTNVRLKLAYISATTLPDEKGSLLDAGISKWNVRPRKLNGEKYLQTIDVPDMNKKGVVLASFLTPLQQSGYKYLVHIDGHVSAFRLSLEMSMGCCILLADSKYRLWFRSMMKPMVDYVPVKADLSDLLNKIKWCRANDKKCEIIAKNARKFYVKYLQKDGMLDYLQKIIIDLKNQAGVYLYNTETPLQSQIKMERDLDLYYPTTEKKIANIGKIPRQARSYGILKGMEWIINLVNKESKFTDVAKKEELVFSNKAKTVMVQKYTLAGFSFIIKATTDMMKQKENIHEAFIGTKVINEIVKYIPNFAYVFGKFNGPTENIVIMEHIFGQTFDKWLQSDKFNMQDYIFILIQLAMALEVAQSVGGFVHYDLAPWNIMIQEIPNPISFDYMLDGTNVFRVTTKIIPVIIDYGKSHVIYKNNHHGYINMYRMSTIQDIISVLLSSLNIVTQFNLSKKDVSDVIKLANFLSGTGYRQKPFKLAGPNGVSDVQFFISRARKYAELISSDKHELEQKTPWDFVKYIMKNFTYKFTYEKIDSPVFRINRGNPRQVFEYVLSSTPEEKTKTFLDVFDRVIACDFPEPVNMFFSYYAAQSLEESVTSVYTLMTQYLKAEKLGEVGSKRYKKAIKKIKNVYSEKLKKDVDKKVDYELSQKFGKLEVASYTEETFSIPDVILNLLHKYDKKDDDLSDYKYIIEQVFLNQGMFKMSDEHREYYLENFSSLLEVNSVNMKTDCANVHTLHNVARDIYSHDKEILDKKLLKSKLKKYNCVAAEKQMAIYNKIDEYFKGEKSESSSEKQEQSESSSEEEEEQKQSESSSEEEEQKQSESSSEEEEEQKQSESSSEEEKEKSESESESSSEEEEEEKLESSSKEEEEVHETDSITITFGDQAENHAGMQKIGTAKENGFTIDELKSIKKKMEKNGLKCEMVNLNDALDGKMKQDSEDAAVLIIRGLMNSGGMSADILFHELKTVHWDTFLVSTRTTEIQRKHARANLCFSGAWDIPGYTKTEFELHKDSKYWQNENLAKLYQAQQEYREELGDRKAKLTKKEIHSGKGTVIKWETFSMIKKFKEYIQKNFGETAQNLVAEGNSYVNLKKCYIGPHGDSERVIVIAIRLGKTFPMFFHWYHKSKPIGKLITLPILNHGDVYIMSEKAVGKEWKSSSKITLRHSAGCVANKTEFKK